jgi:16S rRNA (cytosine967-C5)-methyltransferase
MVNAVLRKLASAPRLSFSATTAAELALAEAHPAWMVERWARFYGLDSARAICRHGQTQPELAIRFAKPSTEAELTQAGVVTQPGQLLMAARIVVSGDVFATSAFREGDIRPQDEGSQLVAEIAAANLSADAGRILDACAAPGGKTLILAERCSQARIVALESSSARLGQLQERLTAFADRVECRLADATQLQDDAVFDLVLADVPCSGTGTLGRNPEIRHRLRPEDLPRQAARQRAILAAALGAVCPGGRVVYSTCSLEPEENEQVVDAVLAVTPNARQLSMETTIAALLSQSILVPAAEDDLRASLTAEGALQLLPGTFHTDGFFIAMIERIA